MSFSQIFFSAVNIPDLLHPLPAAHMFLCSLVFFLWYMFPWHVVLFSSGPPASSPSPPGNSGPTGFLCSACTVLSSWSRKSKAEVQCQTTLDEKGKDGSDSSMNLQVTHTWNPLRSCWDWLQYMTGLQKLVYPELTRQQMESHSFEKKSVITQ